MKTGNPACRKMEVLKQTFHPHSNQTTEMISMADGIW